MEPVIIAIISGLAVTILGGLVVALLKRRWQKIDKKDKEESLDAKELEKLQRAVWRLKKTVLIIAKLVDDQTIKNHPELTSNLEDIASELLENYE